ncbi:MAG: hypothetical protein D3909_16600 [Candidatus Electrothrix sp. ATG1]|nr:hypothetical protein [Candidatus Electrothrix sp. ATG1]
MLFYFQLPALTLPPLFRLWGQVKPLQNTLKKNLLHRNPKKMYQAIARFNRVDFPACRFC